MSMNPSAMV